MRIEIFVVETEMGKLNATLRQKNLDLASHVKLLKQRRILDEELFKCKTDLIKLFGGLTQFKELKGYWINDKGKIESDSVTLWLIYTSEMEDELFSVLLRIKQITRQKCQAYSIDNEIYFI